MTLIAVRGTFLRKYFPKSSVPHIFGRHFLAVDFWLRWFFPIFACRGGPGSAARCGGGPRGTQKLIRSFFLLERTFETLNGRLTPKHGSDRRETLPKRVSGDPRHFIFRRPQTFLATKIFVGKIFRQQPEIFSANCLFWRSCAGLHASIECRPKIHGQTYRFQPSTTLGRGVKKEKTVFFRSYGLKKLIPSPLQNTF